MKPPLRLLNFSFYFVGKNTRYWDDAQGGNAIDVETTSYALLTQMALQRRGYAGPIVVWLTEQRKGGGGFISTQVSESLRRIDIMIIIKKISSLILPVKSGFWNG